MGALLPLLILAAVLAAALACATPRPRGGPASAALGPPSWLAETEVIDWRDPSILRATEAAVADAEGPRERAVRIHDFVRDRVRCGWQPRFYEVRASEVLAAGVGYCNTKSSLFVAMLRAAGIPARVHFVDVDASILLGVIDPGTSHVDHSYTEVWLDGRWVRTDSYIVDLPLAERGRARLAAEGGVLGYGVHSAGTSTWDGRRDAFSQFVDDGSSPDFHRTDFGVHADVMAFYRDAPRTWNELGRAARLFIRWGLGPANRRAAELRGSERP